MCTCQTSCSLSMTVGGRVSTSWEHLAGWKPQQWALTNFKKHQATSSDDQRIQCVFMVDSQKTTAFLSMLPWRCLNGVYVSNHLLLGPLVAGWLWQSINMQNTSRWVESRVPVCRGNRFFLWILATYFGLVFNDKSLQNDRVSEFRVSLRAIVFGWHI